MKTKTTLALLAAFSSLTLAVNAQDGPPPGGDDQGGGPGGGGGRGGMHHPPIPLIVRALDANHDGIIDSNEIANASAVLKTLDKNGDGKLTRDEYMGLRPQRSQGDNGPGPGGDASNSDGPQGAPPGSDQGGPGGPGGGGPGGFGGGPGGGRHMPIPAIVKALDVNGDGIIDSNEIANASAELKTLDKKGDGQLTRDEYLGPRPNRRPPQDDNGGGGDQGGGPQDGPPNGPPPGQN